MTAGTLRYKLACGLRRKYGWLPDRSDVLLNTRSRTARYALALLSVGLAVVARGLLTPWVGPGNYPYVTIFAGTMVASLYGGFVPALVASFLGVGAVDWFFIPPLFTFFPRSVDGWVGFVTALGMCTLIAVLSERMRRAEERAARASEAARSHIALQESEARTRAVLDTVNAGIVSIDEQGRIQSFNRAAERMFGYSAEEMLGQNVRLLMPSPYREEHDNYLASYCRTGAAKVIGIGREVPGQRRDGSTFPLALAVNDTILRGRHLFTAVLRELTEEKAAEERERMLQRRAQQRERLADIGAVTARITHDLGNPLAALSMTAQRILRRIARAPTAPAESLQDAVELLATTTRQLDTLIAGFKDFAREQRLDLCTVQLSSCLQEMSALWVAEASARGIALTVDAPPDVPPVRADVEKLRRVIGNLVRNAIEAIEQGPGGVHISTSLVASGKIRITIEDTGSGIPPGLDVFGLFETTKAQGTGLGLAICKQIVVAHGGDIAFAAGHPTGTVFHIDLPVQGPPSR